MSVAEFVYRSALLAAGLSIATLCVLAMYGSMEWLVNGLHRTRDRLMVVALDPLILAAAWVVMITNMRL